jgi:hypothetical protein
MAKDVEGFKREVRELCERYRIGMVGTCEVESIYGEIMLFDLDHPEKCGWRDVMQEAFNFEDVVDPKPFR